jgi:hypothetical protein
MLFGFLPLFEIGILITIVTFLILSMIARHLYEQFHCHRRPPNHALANAEMKILSQPYVVSVTPVWGNTILLKLEHWDVTTECRAELKPGQVIQAGDQLVQVIMKRTGTITHCSPDWWVVALT